MTIIASHSTIPYLAATSSQSSIIPLRMVGEGGSKRVWKVLDRESGSMPKIRAIAAYRIPSLLDSEFNGMEPNEITEEIQSIFAARKLEALNECTALHALAGSPHVISLDRTIHVTTHEGYELTFLVLPYYSEGTLSSYLKTHTLKTETKKQLFKELLMGLDHCHKKGYYVGDMKPCNVLLYKKDRDIHAVIGDVGTAVQTDNPQAHSLDIHGLFESTISSLISKEDGELFIQLNAIFQQHDRYQFPSAETLLSLPLFS